MDLELERMMMMVQCMDVGGPPTFLYPQLLNLSPKSPPSRLGSFCQTPTLIKLRWREPMNKEKPNMDIARVTFALI